MARPRRRRWLRTPGAAALALSASLSVSVSASVSAQPTEASSTDTPTSIPSTPEDRGDAWVDGPQAPASTQPLPASTAPRDGEADKPPPQEVLVVPEMPPEDKRVDVNDALLPVTISDQRFVTEVHRRQLAHQSAMDLDSALWAGALPGLVLLPQQAGAASLWSRGSTDVGVVVDGVPLATLDGLVSPTEVLSSLGAASLRWRRGPQPMSSALGAHGAILDVDTGGPMTALGASMRADGLLAAGVGGADLEKGAQALVRTGWQTLRVQAHGTLLHRDEQRAGRTVSGVPPVTIAPSLVPGSAGAGGTLGARVDVQPLPESRLFVSWLAGRTVDAGTPSVCSERDETTGRFADCVRTGERGADVAVVGLDARRRLPGMTVQPWARLHAQRALSFEDRSGTALARIDTAADEQLRAGAVVGFQARPDDDVFALRPVLTVAADLFGDRYTSSARSRSLRRRDGAPADGLDRPDLARFVDAANAQTAAIRSQLDVDDGIWHLVAHARLAVQGVRSAAVEDPTDESAGVVRDAVDALVVAPSVGAQAGVDLTAHHRVSLALESVTGTPSPRLLFGGPGLVGDPIGIASSTSTSTSTSTTSPVLRSAGAVVPTWRSVSVTVQQRTAAVDVDVTGFAQLTEATALVVDGVTEGLEARGGLGVEGRVRVKPALEGLFVDGAFTAFAEDVAPLSEAQGPASGVLGPTGSVTLSYVPTSSPVGGYVRVWGALPQARLSEAEASTPALCPERPVDPTVVQERACSGMPGFGVVDAGVFVQLGQLRFDVSGGNAFDAQGRYSGAGLGTGGAAVRGRVAFVF